jgi:hypothetical protein
MTSSSSSKLSGNSPEFWLLFSFALIPCIYLEGISAEVSNNATNFPIY